MHDSQLRRASDAATEQLLHTDAFQSARRQFTALLPGHYRRLGWSAEQLREHQTNSLRELLRTALQQSPFHRARLLDVVGSVDDFELEALARLPIMTKRQMLERYDDVCTDRRLSRRTVEQFLDSAGAQPTTLFDEFVVFASGGSSGERGVFVMHIDLLPDYLASILRSGLAILGQGKVPSSLRFALVAAESSIHPTRAAAALLQGTIGEVCFAPATLPMPDIVERLQQAQPDVIAGYPSVLARLADHQLAGRLAVQPRMLLTTGEQLTDQASAVLSQAFGMPPANSYGTTEGCSGIASPGDSCFTFASDMVYMEFVDEQDQPVAAGESAHHVLITNLHNKTQPLIRYQLDDGMTQQPVFEQCGHVRATVDGRSNEWLVFDGQPLHPHAVRSVLLKTAGVSDYQIDARARRMDVSIQTCGSLDRRRLEAELGNALEVAGAHNITVSVTSVDCMQRDAASGKLRRIVSTEPG